MPNVVDKHAYNFNLWYSYGPSISTYLQPKVFYNELYRLMTRKND